MALTSDPRWRLGLRSDGDSDPGPVGRSAVAPSDIALYLLWLRSDPTIDVGIYVLPGLGQFAWGPAAWRLATRLGGTRLRVGGRTMTLTCEPTAVAHGGGTVLEARLVSPARLEPWLRAAARSWLRCRVLGADGSLAAWQDERLAADGRLLPLPGDWRRPPLPVG